MASGIYCIRNTKNGKRYIGSSVFIEKRVICHFSKLKCNYNENPLMQADYLKYGRSSFESFVLELMPEPEFNNREKFWIDYHQSDKTGYNIRTSKRTSLKLAQMRKRLLDLQIRSRFHVAIIK